MSAKIPLCPTVDELELVNDTELAMLASHATAVLAGKPTPLGSTFTAFVQAKPYFLDRVRTAQDLKRGL